MNTQGFRSEASEQQKIGSLMQEKLNGIDDDISENDIVEGDDLTDTLQFFGSSTIDMSGITKLAKMEYTNLEEDDVNIALDEEMVLSSTNTSNELCLDENATGDIMTLSGWVQGASESEYTAYTLNNVNMFIYTPHLSKYDF